MVLGFGGVRAFRGLGHDVDVYHSNEVHVLFVGFELIKERLDQHDLKALYDVLQNEVLPTYYENHDQWIKMMKANIDSTKECYDVKHMLEDYYNELCAR